MQRWQFSFYPVRPMYAPAPAWRGTTDFMPSFGLIFPYQVRLPESFLIQLNHLFAQACDGAIKSRCRGFLRSEISLRPRHILTQKFVGGITIGGLIYVLCLFRLFDGNLSLFDLLVNLLHQRIAGVILHQQLTAIDLRRQQVALQLLKQPKSRNLIPVA